jgi:hypothetical protein
VEPLQLGEKRFQRKQPDGPIQRRQTSPGRLPALSLTMTTP